ncbi:galactokinase [Lutibacter agarilyticus]|uniref:Galactokinase n=1 Tax=Lutibacter agarilyticus TaxID=1109740 RepID=A0A238Y3M5_9FLAO|nr:galactokinase [Lutibacter agarilyticus]SNR64909.1 galactokinase [Lutibacter agarilyticus]
MNTELKSKIAQEFLENFNEEPILIFSPGRINIIGEHTDYNDGFVFPAAVDKGIIAAISKSNSNESVAIASDLNEKFEFSIDNVAPLKDGNWRNYILGVVGEIQKKGIEVGNFNVVFGGDIPNGSGMSSSAALENSIVFGLNDLFDLGLTKEEMIYISQKAEHNYVGVNCGIMDQYASMFGQKNKALLLDCRTTIATPFEIDFEDYELLLINTNVKHSLADSAYNNRRAVCENAASLLNMKALRDASEEDLLTIKNKISEEDYQKALFVIQENNRAQEASKAMTANDIEKLGALVFGSHDGLQNQYQVSCDELDFLVQLAKEYDNVIGARMMGGGFGGCTINIVKKGKAATFYKLVAPLYKEKFNKECSPYSVNISEGTHKIVK